MVERALPRSLLSNQRDDTNGEHLRNVSCWRILEDPQASEEDKRFVRKTPGEEGAESRC